MRECAIDFFTAKICRQSQIHGGGNEGNYHSQREKFQMKTLQEYQNLTKFQINLVDFERVLSNPKHGSFSEVINES